MRKRIELQINLLLMRTSRAGLDPSGALGYATTGNVGANTLFSSIDVTMVPKNITTAARSRTADGQSGSERFVVVRPEKPSKTHARQWRLQGGRLRHCRRFRREKGDQPVTEGQKVILQCEDPAAPVALPSLHAAVITAAKA
jgi:hypothetical protein